MSDDFEDLDLEYDEIDDIDEDLVAPEPMGAAAKGGGLKKLIVGLLGIAVLGGGGFYYYTTSMTSDAPPPAAAATKAPATPAPATASAPDPMGLQDTAVDDTGMGGDDMAMGMPGDQPAEDPFDMGMPGNDGMNDAGGDMEDPFDMGGLGGMPPPPGADDDAGDMADAGMPDDAGIDPFGDMGGDTGMDMADAGTGAESDPFDMGMPAPPETGDAPDMMEMAAPGDETAPEGADAGMDDGAAAQDAGLPDTGMPAGDPYAGLGDDVSGMDDMQDMGMPSDDAMTGDLPDMPDATEGLGAGDDMMAGDATPAPAGQQTPGELPEGPVVSDTGIGMPPMPAEPALQEPPAMTRDTMPAMPAQQGADPMAGGAPLPAEQAILDNADKLREMQPPAGVQTEDEISGVLGLQGDELGDGAVTPALVRPLPKKYLILEKVTDADNAESRLKAARRALANDDYSIALEIFHELYESNPRDARVLMGRAITFQKLGDFEAALTAYEETLKHDPKNLDALTNMLGLLRKETPEYVVTKLADLRKAYPGNAGITGQLGVAYGALGEYEKGIHYLDIAANLDADDPSYIFNKAVLLDRMGQRTKAVEFYVRSLEMTYRGQRGAQPVPVDAVRKRLLVIQ